MNSEEIYLEKDYFKTVDQYIEFDKIIILTLLIITIYISTKVKNIIVPYCILILIFSLLDKRYSVPISLLIIIIIYYKKFNLIHYILLPFISILIFLVSDDYKLYYQFILFIGSVIIIYFTEINYNKIYNKENIYKNLKDFFPTVSFINTNTYY